MPSCTGSRVLPRGECVCPVRAHEIASTIFVQSEPGTRPRDLLTRRMSSRVRNQITSWFRRPGLVAILLTRAVHDAVAVALEGIAQRIVGFGAPSSPAGGRIAGPRHQGAGHAFA